jgi:pyruvate/2-oxoglutarate dehydrogenase complex dihydrolipoamide acyltransferase (E2) component
VRAEGAVTPTNHTPQVTVGGISGKPRVVDGEIATRELLDLAVTFDHDVVDGAPATRFTQRLGELIEDAVGSNHRPMRDRAGAPLSTRRYPSNP